MEDVKQVNVGGGSPPGIRGDKKAVGDKVKELEGGMVISPQKIVPS